MTTNLPAGIEASLREAGFSGTEMIVLKKLVEEDCLTLRELAAKTGKSTGVLDIAMKKLLSKKIARKENINDQPKYCIHSLEAIVQWVKDDMKTRKETLDRKHQNFETFIASLKVDKVRPDMEYFQGKEGIEKAYEKLLEAGNELLTIAPILSTIEDDPLRAFRVDYFRRRQVRKIFQRIIAPDTVLARRFQSRDPFEYRKTILAPEQELALTFEKTIVGSTVACIDLINETACFIRYPKLADAEKAQFEGMWLRGLTEENQQAPQMKTAIPFKTRFLSYVRQFVLSPRGIFTALFIGCISAALTIGMYQNTRALNLERMKDKVLSIALTGAMQIDLHDLEVLKVQADWRRPEWSKVVNIIKNMRLGNRDITYVYIFRKSMTGSGLEFIADSHSINPFANTDTDTTNDQDTNGDGKIDGSPSGGDYLQWPGQAYLNPPEIAWKALGGEAVSSQFYEDQWGKMVTGYAPIKDSQGSTVAVLAVDMQAAMLDQLDRETVRPVYLFLGLLIFFLFARFAAINPSLIVGIFRRSK